MASIIQDIPSATIVVAAAIGPPGPQGAQGLQGTPGVDGIDGSAGGMSALSDVDLSNVTNGSLLIYYQQLQKWVASTELAQQSFEGGQY